LLVLINSDMLVGTAFSISDPTTPSILTISTFLCTLTSTFSPYSSKKGGGLSYLVHENKVVRITPIIKREIPGFFLVFNFIMNSLSIIITIICPHRKKLQTQPCWQIHFRHSH